MSIKSHFQIVTSSNLQIKKISVVFNPFVPFTKQLLDAMIAKNKKFFVRQTFIRGMPLNEKEVKGAFILTHYDLENEAIVHFDGLKRDHHRFFYDVNDAEHLERLNIAASHPGPYRIFAAIAYPGWEDKAKKLLLKQVRHYVSHGLKWNPKTDDAVNLKLFIQFGELFADMRFNNQQIKVRLSDIENFK